MIKADLHTHTCFSHGVDTPERMFAAAREANLDILGFSEHSPRPEGFNYSHEYREKLTRHWPDYVTQVASLKKNAGEGEPQVLFGMEVDWLEGEEDFIRRACAANDFDYLVGSVHFLGTWGFDDGPDAWRNATREECEKHYERYFGLWNEMLASGLFQIAAHPDLIKIFSVEAFHAWLRKPRGSEIVRECLATLKEAGMAMEISSAGLRKACAEIYPCPEMMALAAETGVEISLASDAHRAKDVGHAFQEIVAYAQSFGFARHVVFEHGRCFSYPF